MRITSNHGKSSFSYKSLMPIHVLCFILFLPLFAYSNETDKNIETAFHFSVEIDEKAEKVWPLLFEIDKWKYSIEKLENKVLTGDREGGVVAIYKDGSAQPGLTIETLKILLHRHYSFSIYSNTGKFIGFAAYNLKEERGKTYLTYDIYLHTILSGITQDQATLRKHKIVESMEKRQPEELAALKALVES